MPCFFRASLVMVFSISPIGVAGQRDQPDEDAVVGILEAREARAGGKPGRRHHADLRAERKHRRRRAGGRQRSAAATERRPASNAQGGRAASWHPVCGSVKRNSTLLRHLLAGSGAPRPQWPVPCRNNLLRQPNFAALVVLAWLAGRARAAAAVLAADRRDAARHRRRHAARRRCAPGCAGPAAGSICTRRGCSRRSATTSHWSRLIDAGLAGLLSAVQARSPTRSPPSA